MNVVPVSGPNTLPVIYDRGLLGVMHDWYKLIIIHFSISLFVYAIIIIIVRRLDLYCCW